MYFITYCSIGHAYVTLTLFWLTHELAFEFFLYLPFIPTKRIGISIPVKTYKPIFEKVGGFSTCQTNGQVVPAIFFEASALKIIMCSSEIPRRNSYKGLLPKTKIPNNKFKVKTQRKMLDIYIYIPVLHITAQTPKKCKLSITLPCRSCYLSETSSCPVTIP